MITYAAEIWGLSENMYVERVHTFAIKRFLSIPIHSSNTLVYGETGRYAPFIGTFVKCIKYWIKLAGLSPFRLCRQACEMLFIQSEAEKKNWASQVKQVLTRNGFGHVWLCQDVGNERIFFSRIQRPYDSMLRAKLALKKIEEMKNILGSTHLKTFFSLKNICHH